MTTFIDDSRNLIGLKNGDINIIKNTELPIADRYSTGSSISKHNLTNAFIVANLKKENTHQEQLVEVSEVKEAVEEKKIPKKEQISLSEIDGPPAPSAETPSEEGRPPERRESSARSVFFFS